METLPVVGGSGERPPTEDPLSRREKEVLALVAEGITNREIAGKLVISDNTVRNHISHISHIMDKLDITRRSQAAAYAVRGGIDSSQSGPGTEPGAVSN